MRDWYLKSIDGKLEMGLARTLSWPSRVALILVGCLMASMAAVNARTWWHNILSGKIEGTYSFPVYGPMVVPDGHDFGASGKLGADHASLYFTAKDYLSGVAMYDPTVDPWQRTAETFPPHLVFLTAHTTAQLDFPNSALLNNLAQIGLFFAVAAYFLHNGPSPWTLRMAAAGVSAFAVFCTPVGVTWFERAQTDLYCASAILLLLKGMRDGEWTDFLLAGLVASIKWSSLPFVALAAIPYVALATLNQVWRRIVLIGLSLCVPFLLLAFFGEDGFRYLTLVYRSESGHLDGPAGVSLTLYFPKIVAKLMAFTLPFSFVVFEYINRRPNRSGSELIFWATAGLVSASFGTTAYEYRMLSTLFILPLAVDGRSVLFSDQELLFSNASRLIGLLLLAYALRVQTTGFLDGLIASHRGIVPLIAGLLLIMVWSSVEWGSSRIRSSKTA